MNELEGVTVFEAKTVRTGQKRKREDKGDPGDLEGYKGPWRGYVDQEMVSRPTKEQMAILEEQFGDKQKTKKEKDETIEESSMLHSEWGGVEGGAGKIRDGVRMKGGKEAGGWVGNSRGRGGRDGR